MTEVRSFFADNTLKQIIEKANEAIREQIAKKENERNEILRRIDDLKNRISELEEKKNTVPALLEITELEKKLSDLLKDKSTDEERKKNEIMSRIGALRQGMKSPSNLLRRKRMESEIESLQKELITVTQQIKDRHKTIEYQIREAEDRKKELAKEAVVQQQEYDPELSDCRQRIGDLETQLIRIEKELDSIIVK